MHTCDYLFFDNIIYAYIYSNIPTFQHSGIPKMQKETQYMVAILVVIVIVLFFMEPIKRALYAEPSSEQFVSVADAASAYAKAIRNRV